jgi:Phage integrase, N-terminal SAM-like domain
MDMEGQPETPILLDQVRNVLRLHHSIHTERSYIDWIKRYIHLHHMRYREDLADGERKIEAFLTDLALRGKVPASTPSQAMNEATLKPYGSQPVGTLKPPRGYPEATLRLTRGYPEAPLRLP